MLVITKVREEVGSTEARVSGGRASPRVGAGNIPERAACVLGCPLSL